MRTTSARVLAVLAAAAVAISGCATTQAEARPMRPEELRAEVERRVPGLRFEVPYEVDEADIARARGYVAGADLLGDRFRALVRSLFSPQGFGLSWAPISTATARETLATKKGNCLSLAAVFIGLARGVGLDARFIDASVEVSDITQPEPDLAVNEGHISAMIEYDRHAYYLDFERAGYIVRTFRVMTDLEAVAHFYNNRGYEKMELARYASTPTPWDSVAADFEIAAKLIPRFAVAWNNLGLAQTHLGRTAEAEAAFRTAIAANPSTGGAYNNLGNLLFRQGRLDEAVKALRVAVSLEPKAAHTHFNLGRALIAAGDVAAAERELERAQTLNAPGADALLEKLAIYRCHQAELDELEPTRRAKACMRER
jgi:tetratricopeptide (TPR) repeat protein